MTHAEWGCSDDEHKAWMIVEVESKKEAISILPPAYRRNAKIVALQNYTIYDLDEALVKHDNE
jgi:hypothetical protein